MCFLSHAGLVRQTGGLLLYCLSVTAMCKRWHELERLLEWRV